MKQYCKGKFRSWDPMITTPPGLWVLIKFSSERLLFVFALVFDVSYHASQTRWYCRYLVTYMYTSVLRLGVAALEGAFLWSDTCTTAVLRHVNILFAIICAVLFREITLHLEPDKGAIFASLKAFALSCYPLHWFFTFLFYTDVGSTTAVLAMYLACLKQAYWTSSLVSNFFSSCFGKLAPQSQG